MYDSKYTYAHCIENHQVDKFEKLLGCTPPWMSRNNPCQGHIPLSLEGYTTYMARILQDYMIFFLNAFDIHIPDCEEHCLQTQFNLNKLIRRRLFSKTYNKNTIEIMFAEPVKVIENIQGIAIGFFMEFLIWLICIDMR